MGVEDAGRLLWWREDQFSIAELEKKDWWTASAPAVVPDNEPEEIRKPGYKRMQEDRERVLRAYGIPAMHQAGRDHT